MIATPRPSASTTVMRGTWMEKISPPMSTFAPAKQLTVTQYGRSRHLYQTPDGALYIAQTVRGWMSTEGNEGLQRVVWNGDRKSVV